MINADDNQTVYWLLMQLMFQAKHQINLIAENYNLTVMQVNSLILLKPDEPLAMNVLSHYFMCDASNVTGIVDRLEKQQLIRRQDHPTDRRIKMIALTNLGSDLRSKILVETVAAEAKSFEHVLEHNERQTLQTILKKALVSADSPSA